VRLSVGSLDVEGLLEELHQVGELDEGHLLERLDQLFVAELRHDRRSFLFGSAGAG
jgi:hypothetical protein